MARSLDVQTCRPKWLSEGPQNRLLALALTPPREQTNLVGVTPAKDIEKVGVKLNVETPASHRQEIHVAHLQRTPHPGHVCRKSFVPGSLGYD